MVPPIPPRHGRTGSGNGTRGAVQRKEVGKSPPRHNLTESRPMRDRLDSTGSTRGAFFSNPSKEKHLLHQHPRHHRGESHDSGEKRKQKKRTPPPKTRKGGDFGVSALSAIQGDVENPPVADSNDMFSALNLDGHSPRRDKGHPTKPHDSEAKRKQKKRTPPPKTRKGVDFEVSALSTIQGDVEDPPVADSTDMFSALNLDGHGPRREKGHPTKTPPLPPGNLSYGSTRERRKVTESLRSTGESMRSIQLHGTGLLDSESSMNLESIMMDLSLSSQNLHYSFPSPASHRVPYSHPYAQDQQQQIAQFSSQALNDYEALPEQIDPQPVIQQPRVPPKFPVTPVPAKTETEESEDEVEESGSLSGEDLEHEVSFLQMLRRYVDPVEYLMSDALYDEDGEPYFDEKSTRWTLAGLLRHFLYNPLYPEFTSLQQFSWAIILGVVMGIYTAVWKEIIEHCVDFVWQTVPAALLRWGFFTDLDGRFPLPNYVWLAPSVFGGVLSYINASLSIPIPGQNEWLKSLHLRGVQSHETFLPLFIISTMAMASGMSLGPELPLVLTAGMAGSWLAVSTNQSILQARTMNMTAAGAAVGGFFGFPMAGAIFVLELPHRMGLQYFEAISPATIASIAAVLTNRLVLQNDVTGYYNYPFLTQSLPSEIFTAAILYGLCGSAVGIVYCESVKFLKHKVHDLFHKQHHGDEMEGKAEEIELSEDLHVQHGNGDETKPLVKGFAPHQKPVRALSCSERLGRFFQELFSCAISHEPTRAAVVGTMAGFVVGTVGMFVPHVMFWGEAQLQSLIDKGRTPLPVFGEGRYEYTKDITAYGYCLIDPKDDAAIAAGFSIGCAALISASKIFVTGLSLGTGLVCGQFWSPLFVACAAGHLITDLGVWSNRIFGFGQSLADYPCVALLCMMGSTHVVTFRAHLAITLILTLTISAFDPENENAGGTTAGDYSAVFPLLVVSVFISLMISRDTVFYSEQRCRGDIMALPEVLCEPGKEGAPMIVDYEDDAFETSSWESSSTTSSERVVSDSSSENVRAKKGGPPTASDIEREFQAMTKRSGIPSNATDPVLDNISSNQLLRRESDVDTGKGPFVEEAIPGKLPDVAAPSDEDIVLPMQSPAMLPRSSNLSRNAEVESSKDFGTTDFALPDRLEELLSRPMEKRMQSSKDLNTSDFSLPPSDAAVFKSPDRLDELLSRPMEKESPRPRGRRHRRAQSAPVIDPIKSKPLDMSTPDSSLERTPRGHHRTSSIGPIRDGVANGRTGAPSGSRLVHVNSFGEVPAHQPSLLDQARLRAASRHNRVPSFPRFGRHSRKNSEVSVGSQRSERDGRRTRTDSEASSGSMRLSDTGEGAAAFKTEEFFNQVFAKK